MTQFEIDIQVSMATGECLAEIQRLGFGVADPIDVNFDPEPRWPLVLDDDTISAVELLYLYDPL